MGDSGKMVAEGVGALVHPAQAARIDTGGWHVLQPGPRTEEALR
jgi:hypothetical protein